MARASASVSATVMAAMLAAGVTASAAAGAGCGMRSPTEARLTLADARITIDQADGRHHELTLAATGVVRWDGVELVTIGKNGALRRGDRELAKVDKHGKMTIGGQPTNLMVTPDGVFVLDDVAELTIDRDGVVAGPLFTSIDHPAVELDGSKVAYLGPPAARAATLLGFVTLITPSLSPETPPAAPPR